MILTQTPAATLILLSCRDENMQLVPCKPAASGADSVHHYPRQKETCQDDGHDNQALPCTQCRGMLPELTAVFKPHHATLALPNIMLLHQVLVESQARAVRRQRADAEKAAAETRSERLAAGATQREHSRLTLLCL